MPINRRVLIIEEEALLALDIEYVLADRGPLEITHFRNVAEAERRLTGPLDFDLAIVEARLGARPVVAMTERLMKAGIPTVVMSADHASFEFFPHAVPLAKPFDTARLIAACDAAGARIS